MLSELIPNRVYYRIFDKTNQESTHIYSKHLFEDGAKKAEVQSNIEAIKNSLAASELLILQQVHGTEIIDTDQITDFSQQAIGDGAITTKTGVALAVQTADCVPLLLASHNMDIIGAAHCGWKGSKAGIVSALIRKMRERGADTLKAVIGPAIQQSSYEVDQEYYHTFFEAHIDYQHFFIPSQRQGHYMFNLPKFVELQLQNNDITDITNLEEDTYSMPDKYPSYRRNCHQGLGRSRHNILSTILIK